MDSTLGAGSSLGGTLLRAAVQISGDDKPTATVKIFGSADAEERVRQSRSYDNRCSPPRLGWRSREHLLSLIPFCNIPVIATRMDDCTLL